MESTAGSVNSLTKWLQLKTKDHLNMYLLNRGEEKNSVKIGFKLKFRKHFKQDYVSQMKNACKSLPKYYET